MNVPPKVGLRPGSGWLGQRLAEAGLAYPPEVDLHTVHEGDRNLVPVLGEVFRRRLVDVTLFPADANLRRHPRDDRSRVIAQVTAGTAEQDDAVRPLGASVPRGRRPPPPP